MTEADVGELNGYFGGWLRRKAIAVHISLSHSCAAQRASALIAEVHRASQGRAAVRASLGRRFGSRRRPVVRRRLPCRRRRLRRRLRRRVLFLKAPSTSEATETIFVPPSS